MKGKSAPEGIEALKEVSGSLREVLENLAGGIRAGLGYLGAPDLSNLAKILVSSGLRLPVNASPLLMMLSKLNAAI